jgi:hypothetical protein
MLFRFNSAYPQIKNDLLKRYNPKLITAQFFTEYLQQYLMNLDRSRGVTATETGIGNIELAVRDLQALLPNPALLARVNERVRSLGKKMGQLDRLEPLMDRLDALVLPDVRFYQKIDELMATDPVEAADVLRRVQDALQTIPTKDEIADLLERDFTTMKGELDALSVVVGGLSNQMIDELDAVMTELGVIKGQKQATKKATASTREYVKIDKAVPVLIPNVGNFKANSGALQVQTPNGEFIPLSKIAFKEFVLSDPDKVQQLQSMGISLSLEGLKTFVIQQQIERETTTKSEVAFKPAPPTAVKQTGNIQEAFKRGAEKEKARKTAEQRGKLLIIEEDTASSTGSQKAGVGIKLRKIGKGIAIEREPTYAEFGKYAIHLGQLKNNDILNVKYKSLGGIPHFKPTPISDSFKDFILDVLENGKANQRVYDNIPPDERKLFEKIASGAGIFHTLKLKKTVTDQDKEDNNRFEILKGEYLAGNTSHKILAELRRFVIKFMGEGKISRNDGMNLLMELSLS